MRHPDPSTSADNAAVVTVELDRAGVVIDGRTIIAPTTLTLKERRIGVIGANGSGKSTFARLLNGLVVPTTGAVRIDGLDTAREAAKIRRSVGFVFQNPDNQIVFPIIAEDMAFGLKNSGLAKVEIPTRVTAELARLGIAHLVERASHSLSGGEKQLAALAAVLVMRPKLVVFDEPTTLLDLKNRNRIRAVIDALAASALVVTHDLDLVERFDRVLVIEDGRIAADDTPRAAIAWYRERAAA